MKVTFTRFRKVVEALLVKSELKIGLKYYAGRPVIERFGTCFNVTVCVFTRVKDPEVMNGLGAIISPPQGVRQTVKHVQQVWAAKLFATSPKERNMSRVGKIQFQLPAGAEVTINQQT